MSAFLSGNYNTYIGTKNFVRDTFPITHKNKPIFKREFDASSLDVVGIAMSTITISDHYFTTGEELEYGFDLDSYHQPIGIALTTIPGIGLTDKLPSKVFVRKINDLSFYLTGSAEDALKTNPKILEFKSLGIGTAHYLKSKDPNKKVLITIDNIIQTPIVSTATTTFLDSSISFFTNILQCNNANSFFVRDILKIDDEIVRVESVGFGSDNYLFVKRGFMGTGITTHASGATVTKLTGSFNINEDNITFASAPFGDTPKPDPNNPSYIDVTGIQTRSTFSGRVFTRSGVLDGNEETYTDNYIFDDISNYFTGVTSSFTLKINNNDVTDIKNNNSIVLFNNIMQFPSRSNIDRNYRLEDDGYKTDLYVENPRINQENYDINSTNLPVGGRIVSIGSSAGGGYQPLRVAIGTAVIVLGSISNISVGDSGSGYRPDLQTINVGVLTTGLEVQNVGYATASNGSITSITITNPLSGLASTNPPEVVFDYPIGYENIPLVYSSQSQAGIGTGASVDIFVSNNGSVRDFVLKNNGYGYKEGDILTIPTLEQNSLVGIPTTTALNEFKIYVEETYTDTFSGWSIGELEILDSPQKYFNGVRTVFPISANGKLKSIRAAKGSLIDMQSTLLVFLNDVLQTPGSGYIFKGGSIITFAEPPKPEDKCDILFYRGTIDIDVVDVDILETIQIGDNVEIKSDDFSYDEDERLVKNIISVDTIQTNNYSGPGIDVDQTNLRPIKWCKTVEDRFVNGSLAPKSRISYEPIIYPVSNIIQNVGLGTTALIYVENIKKIFDDERENLDDKFEGKIDIISQTSNVVETFENVKYYGDCGKVTRIIPEVVEGSKFALKFKLLLDSKFNLSDTQISVGDYFVINNSNVGYGVTSLRNDDTQISVGTTYMDNVYQVYSTEPLSEQTITSTLTINSYTTYGSPTIIENDGLVIIDNDGQLLIESDQQIYVTCKVSSYNNITKDLSPDSADYYGNYSWGKMTAFKRRTPKSFSVYKSGDTIGINSSPVVRRSYPLKYEDYLL